jgi:glucose dehydrogenase
LRGAAVTEDALDAALLLFVFCLGTFPWWEVGLWLWELLAPRLALLDDLLLWLCLVATVGGSCDAVVVGLGLEALIVGVVVL